MRKILTWVLSFLMCFTFIPNAYAESTQINNEIIINEYDAVKSLASEPISVLSKQGYSEDEINKIKNYKDAFTEYFNSLKILKDSDLLEAGYTNKQINILRNFSGTDSEMRGLGAKVTLTIPISYVTWSSSQKRTNAKFNVNFSWSTQPLIVTTDVVGINWNDWTLSSSSSKITYKRKVGTPTSMPATITGTATKVNNDGPRSYGLAYKFKMNANKGYHFAKNGSFTIVLYNNYNKKDLSVYAKYGHNQISVSPTVSMPGYGSISFNYGVSTVAQQWNDRKCS